MSDSDYNRLRETALGEDLYKYLQARNSLPKINRVPYIKEGTSGEYTRSTNNIDLLDTARNTTLTHEVGHSADNALGNQYWNRPTSWSRPDTPTYFTDAYDKLKGDSANTNYQSQRELLAQKMAPEWFKRNQDYRAKGNELAGWGVGRQAGPVSTYTPPDHLDSTMATELSILMDLARRKDVPFPKEPSLFERLFKR